MSNYRNAELEAENLSNLSISRDAEIEEIKKELTELSGGRLSNYWYYAEKSKTVAAKMARLVKRLIRIGNEVLKAESDLTGCDMVAGDGYYPWAIAEIATEMAGCEIDEERAEGWLETAVA